MTELANTTPQSTPWETQEVEGVAEGFELAEEELIDAAENIDREGNPLADAFTPEADGGLATRDLRRSRP